MTKRCWAFGKRRMRSICCWILGVGPRFSAAAFGGSPIGSSAEGRKDGGDGLIVRGELLIQPCLQLRKAPGEFPVGAEQIAQLHEGAHDLDVDGALAAQNRRASRRLAL
jgi:hypothetical protein